MADLILENFNYDYDGQISEEIFYKPSIDTPDFSLFRILPGVNFKRQLTLAPNLAKIVKSDTGCAIDSNGQVVLNNRTLEVCEFAFRLDQCYDQFRDNWLVEKLPEGISKPELGQFILNIATTLIVDALRRDNFRIFSFGDANAGSDDYNQCDGLWRRLIDGEAGYGVTKVNDITTLNQTDGTRALDYLRNLYEQSPIILKQLQPNQKVFAVTGNVYENLMTTYEDKSLDGGGLTTRVEDGVTRLSFRGVDVLPIYAWDSALVDPDNPFNGVFDTGIIYTERQNHVIGVQRASDLGQVEQWYEKKDRKVYFQGTYKMGYNYVHDDLTSISYGVLS